MIMSGEGQIKLATINSIERDYKKFEVDELNLD